MEDKIELTLGQKKKALDNNLDLVYKICQENKMLAKYFDTFDDFVQECFLIAYENIGKWDKNRSALSTFLYRTVKWKIMKKSKANGKKQLILLDDLFGNEEEVEKMILKYNQDLIEKEEDNYLLEMIIPLLSEISYKYFIEEETLEDLSKITSKSISKIQNEIVSDIKAAKEKLKNFL